MKKSLIAAITSALVVGVAGTTFAAANPFVDVPAKHWAYDAVAKLAKDGIVDGYGDGTFRGDKTITRYEMAQIVAKAMTKADKANAADKAAIDKLAVEFAAELNNLGVRVAKLEDQVGTIKVTGDARIRYQSNYKLDDKAGTSNENDRWQERIRLNLSAKVADNVDFAGRMTSQWISDETNGNTTDSSKNDARFDIAKFTFKNVLDTGSNISIGRDVLTLGQGLLFSDKGGFDSVRATFGSKVVNGFVAYGDISGCADTLSIYKTGGINGEKAANIGVANVTYKPSNYTTVTGSYIAPTSKDLKDYKVWSLGTNVKFAQTMTFTGEYAKNTETDDSNKAWWTKLGYKGANKANVGSWGAYVDYRYVQSNAVDGGATGLNAMDNGKYDAVKKEFGNGGAKGYGVGFNYTLAKNAVFTGEYEKLKQADDNINNEKDHDPFYYAKLDFNF